LYWPLGYIFVVIAVIIAIVIAVVPRQTSTLFLLAVALLLGYPWLRRIASQDDIDAGEHIRDSIKEGENIRYVFVLIHGTWARNADWCKDDSELCKQLRSTYPVRITVFHRFAWKGWNSALVRHKASEELARHLDTFTEAYPNAEIVIIAHSHGGNIACYALRARPHVEKRVSAIVCLSTPFLHIRERRNPHEQYAMIAMLTWLIVFSIIAIETLYDVDPMSSLGTAIAFALLFLIVFTPHALNHWLRFCHSIAEATKLPQSPSPAILLVRTAADEASVGLVLCQFGVWIVSKAWLILMLPYLAFAIAMTREQDLKEKAGNPQNKESNNSTSSSPIGDIPFIPIGLLCLFAVGLVGHYALEILSVITVGSLLMLLIVGPALAFSHFFLDVSVEPSPPGIHTIRQFGFRGDIQQQIKAWFNHSLPYQTPEIIATIDAWLRQTIGDHPSSASAGTRSSLRYTCFNCGSMLLRGSQFCTQCGEKISLG
jgi:pimeloyl-ACP methyl ester carboxylesterase